MNAYYNEIDAEKAAWIRELIKAGAVAPGEVDERSIKDVRADDLRGFSQCHFFAGIAVWSYALRLAGWTDDRKCWTGSCPCPSFSAAGKGQGFADARHLWPDWMRLIRECKPSVVFGEQVEAAIGHGWLDLVQTDLENETYAVGKAVLGACSVGAPHRRQRLYFVGLANAEHAERRAEHQEHGDIHGRNGLGGSGDSGWMADASARGWGMLRSAPGSAGHAESGDETGGLADTDGGKSGLGDLQRSGKHGQQPQDDGAGFGMADAEHPGLSRAQGSEAIEDRDESGLGIPERDGGESGRMADTRALGCRRRERTTQGRLDDGEVAGRREGDDESIGRNEVSCTASPFSHTLNGFWRDADWLLCTDGRWRPVEPGTFPLATGTPASLGRLRGYGDALNAQTAREFIEAVMN